MSLMVVLLIINILYKIYANMSNRKYLRMAEEIYKKILYDLKNNDKMWNMSLDKYYKDTSAFTKQKILYYLEKIRIIDE